MNADCRKTAGVRRSEGTATHLFARAAARVTKLFLK